MRRKQPHSKNGRSGQTGNNQLRIIGGQWRGRKLTFPSVEGLRPTPDRVRETLFNWLAPDIVGARCLDLFCGSGALSFEALSRGATLIDMVDNTAAVTRQLKANAELLHCEGAQVHAANALAFIATQPAAYDIIFLDPPFRKGFADDCIQAIIDQGLLKSRAWLYLEMGRDEPLPNTPSEWRLHREKNAGQICYRLYAIGL